MLKLEIEEAWEPEDFIAAVLQATESLYYKAVFARLYYGGFPAPRPRGDYFFWAPQPPQHLSFEDNLSWTNEWWLQQARYVAVKDVRLRVSRIEYASPGGIDLIGVGQACDTVRGIIDSIIAFYTERHLRQERDKQAKLDTEKKEIEVEKDREELRSLQIDNARKLLELVGRKRTDIAEQILVSLIVHDQEQLSKRIAEGKIIRVQASSQDAPAKE
jgi:hypothetical protein